MGKAEPRPFDLPRTRLATQMEADFIEVRDTGRAERMPLGEQPTRYVDRDVAAECGVAAVDQGAASASLTKTEILVMQDFGRGEAVMKFDEVEVGDVDPRSRIGLQGGGARDLVEISQPVFDVGVDAAERCFAAHPHRPAHQAMRSEEHTSELQSLMRISY